MNYNFLVQSCSSGNLTHSGLIRLPELVHLPDQCGSGERIISNKKIQKSSYNHSVILYENIAYLHLKKPFDLPEEVIRIEALCRTIDASDSNGNELGLDILVLEKAGVRIAQIYLSENISGRHVVATVTKQLLDSAFIDESTFEYKWHDLPIKLVISNPTISPNPSAIFEGKFYDKTVYKNLSCVLGGFWRQ
ncbi:MAG: hypothetical protein SGJ18_06555 [Pseudomonadota bacterium]|nr:hypothetical protein [Pseudomonadota bacterium]